MVSWLKFVEPPGRTDCLKNELEPVKAVVSSAAKKQGENELLQHARVCDNKMSAHEDFVTVTMAGKRWTKKNSLHLSE